MRCSSQRSKVVTRRCRRWAARVWRACRHEQGGCGLRHEVRRWGAGDVQSDGREERVRRRWRRERGRWTGGGGGGDIIDSPSEVRREFLIWKAVLRLSFRLGNAIKYEVDRSTAVCCRRAGLRLTQQCEQAEVSSGDLGGCLGK